MITFKRWLSPDEHLLILLFCTSFLIFVVQSLKNIRHKYVKEKKLKKRLEKEKIPFFSKKTQLSKKMKRSLLSEPVSKRIKQPITLQKAFSKSTKETVSFDEQDTSTTKQINREIEEAIDGSKRVKEVETSFTNSKSRKREHMLEIKQDVNFKMNILSSNNPSLLIQQSAIGGPRFTDIESNRSAFIIKYPSWNINNNKDILFNKMFEEALEVFGAAPFVDASWIEIIDTGRTLTEEDVVSITLNKLVWNAALTDSFDKSWDPSAELSLVSFDIDQYTADMRFVVAERNIDFIMTFDHVDSFLLMTLPKSTDRKRVQVYTQVLAKQALRDM